MLTAPDRVAAWVAGRQLALITTPQLRASGLQHDAIGTRRRKGLLHRVHHGVYLFGTSTFLPGARELAAVLACGESGCVSHESAAALWGLIAHHDGDVHITIAGSSRRRREGIQIHRMGALDPDDVRELRGIPVVSPARALLDYAPIAAPAALERSIAEAYALRLTTERELSRMVARNPHRPGVGVLRAELAREQGPRWTRREGERQVKELIRRADLPPPLTNVVVAGYEADFFWPQQRLVVEFDGYQFHGHRRAFERDRRRDAAHVLAGYRVIRITWRQLTEEPLRVAAILAAALSANRAPG